MGHTLALLGIGLMVQSVIPMPGLVGFIIFLVGIILSLLGR